jgi:selenocysteine lyase/cysteine desulfurase
MTALVERARASVLRFFNASAEEYVAIFTPNATGALKLVGEAYPFAEGGRYLLTYDNHNSVNGIREFAHARGAEVGYVPLVPPDLRVDDGRLEQDLATARSGAANLFAYPAQSNFSGVQHPLSWVDKAQQAGWDVLVDAAAFAPTNRLDLSAVKPDFVDLSFYKMFGYPTGIGCLIARKDALAKLHRPWWAGGTIAFASVKSEGFYLNPGPAGFEDGTVNYLGIPAVETGLAYLETIGIDTIHRRVTALTGWLLQQLLDLRHSNGRPLIRLYGPATTRARGATVEVNFHDPDGSLFDSGMVEAEANARNISLRAGCHCNPGAREVSFGFSEEDLAACFRDADRMTYEEFLHAIDGKTTGAVRASLGLPSNFADVYEFVSFAATFVDRRVGDSG